jgi:hypothetical protein
MVRLPVLPDTADAGTARGVRAIAVGYRNKGSFGPVGKGAAPLRPGFGVGR